MTYHLHGHHGHDRTTTRKPRLKLLAVASLFLAGLLAPLATSFVQATVDSTPAAAPLLLITGIQTGGCTTVSTTCTEVTNMEYVQVYNPSDSALSVSGWKLRYLSSSGSTVTELAAVSGTLAAHSYSLFAHTGHYADIADFSFGTASNTGKLAKSGGHVDITDSSGNIIDRVGWGSAAQPLTKAISAPAAGKILERKTDQAGLFIHTADNSHDFAVVDTASLQSGGFTAPIPEPAPDPVTPTPIPTEPTPTTPTAPVTSCEGIIISELLPNPAGSDSGHEFIELHNPTDETISLDGCSLQSSASSTKTYALDHITMEPSEYHSLSDTATGITLPNSAGGTAWLLSPTDELQTITYPADMADDTSWALTSTTWATTYTPTPGAANVVTPLKPCDDPTQVRNADTGRCAAPTTTDTTITSAATTTTSGLSPCKAGQERNPETNRCRNIASTTTVGALTPCKEGQERNPETNRCKAAGSTTDATKACPAGQERNPETNRCRKILAGPGNTVTDIKDASSDGSSANKPKPLWLIGAFVAVVAVGYAIYEWRQELSLFINRRFGKILNKLPFVNLKPLPAKA